MIAWVRALAEKDEETKFLCLESGTEGHTSHAVRESLGEKDPDATPLIAIDDGISAVLSQLRKESPRLLVTDTFEATTSDGKVQTLDKLVLAAPCQTFAPFYGGKGPSEVDKILLVISGDVHDRSALGLVETLRKRLQARVTIGVVEEKTSAKAGQAGKRWIQGLLQDLVLDEELFEIKVVADRLKHRGVLELFEDHDLVVIGANAASFVRPLRQSLGDATAAIVSRTPPLRGGAMVDWLPRINPAVLADLRHDLRLGSNLGPDFIGMLGLASAIASLGLMQNSPAVVIGSMLLAPLMTPMIGLGLGLAQADLILARLCAKSIGIGFLLTLTVSFLIGFATPSGETLSEEVFARGGPNVLDLFIAVFAAAAATFAMARPNISGAIAGVAIATALVPPVCSVGISLAFGEWLNAFGALALFFTNLIAIIVMSNLTFALLGVTASRVLPRYRLRARLLRVGLVALLLVLAGPLSTTLIAQLEAGKSVALAHPVTTAVHRALFARVARDEGVEIMFMARPRAEERVVIHIASRDELPTSYADELTKIVRQVMDDPDLDVTVVAVRGLWRKDNTTR